MLNLKALYDLCKKLKIEKILLFHCLKEENELKEDIH
jgi:hypothetical protein